MKIRTILFQQTFPTGLQYSNQRFGMEIDLEEGEDPKEVYKKAKRIVNDTFWAINPQLRVDTSATTGDELPTTIVEPKEKRLQAIISDINSCKEVKVLEGYRLIVQSMPELKEAYDKKMEELSNGRSKQRIAELGRRT